MVDLQQPVSPAAPAQPGSPIRTMTPLSADSPPPLSYGPSAVSITGSWDPPSPVPSLVARTRVLVAPSFRSLLKVRASKFLWRRTMIGPCLSPDKKGGWKLPPKVASARRQRQAASARAVTAAAGGRSSASSAASTGHNDDDDDDSCPGGTEESDDDSSDDEDGDEDEDERPLDLGAKISGKKLTAIRKKVGGHAMYSSKTEKWQCGTCIKTKMKCSFARGIYIRSNKVTARFADHNKTKVHLEAVDREASRLSAESGVRIFFHADIS